MKIKKTYFVSFLDKKDKKITYKLRFIYLLIYIRKYFKIKG